MRSIPPRSWQVAATGAEHSRSITALASSVVSRLATPMRLESPSVSLSSSARFNEQGRKRRHHLRVAAIGRSRAVQAHLGLDAGHASQRLPGADGSRLSLAARRYRSASHGLPLPSRNATACSGGITWTATMPSPPPGTSGGPTSSMRSEEHTSELQSRPHLVCRLLLEKKKNKT